MNLTIDQLSKICTRPAGTERAAVFVEPLNRWLAHFNMTDPRVVACFLAQILHESAEFTSLRENTNYSSPERLLAVFGKRFASLDEARQYAGKPEAIANHVYALRNGNGSEASGDGWRFRGGGCIQTTGKENYAAAGQAMAIDLVMHPELIAQPDAATGSACFFWDKHDLTELAIKGDFGGITRVINGGTNGLAERLNYLGRARKALGISV